MGNDGGSIPTRRELVKEAARNPSITQLKESIQEQQQHAWNIDPLSQQTLSNPVVSDFLGRLFNKDSIIEHLLSASDELAVIRHLEREQILKGAVKSLRDVVEVKFEVDASHSLISQKDKRSISRTEKWICPITHKELGPGIKTVYLVPCGHAFSEAAIKEVSGGICMKCNEEYVLRDVIPVLAISEADNSSLALRIQTLNEQGLTHSLKKVLSSSKKRKRAQAESETTNPNQVAATKGSAKTPQYISTVKQARTSAAGISGIGNSATASLTAKISEEQEMRHDRQSPSQNGNKKHLFTNRNMKKSSSEGR